MLKRSLLLLILLAGWWTGAVAQFTVSGTVVDEQSGETLIGATIYDTISRKGTTTNQHGRYSLTLKQPRTVIRVSFVGYKAQYYTLELKANHRIDARLENALTLQEVMVIGRRVEHVEGSSPSRIELPVEQVKTIPMLFGETDFGWPR